MARILLVDDSRLSRSMEGDALRAAGHDVTEAVNGADGLDKFAAGEFELIVSDVLMPVCDGLQMLQQLRGAGHTLPVIMCSADIQDSTRGMCESLGIAAFLNKPVKADRLQLAVSQTLALCPAATP